ncbi:MAG: restriction endonuclease subunit S [Lachnospiraceae bacterium]
MAEPLRLDAEYYSKSNLILENLITDKKGRTVEDYKGIVDCSAFYPSITRYYSKDKSLVPFLRVNEICNGLVVLTENTVFLPHKILDDNPSTISVAYPGDIIIAKGGNTLAKVGLVTDEYTVYATCRDVIILRTNKLERINKYYLWSFLHSKYGQELMWRAASQTGQPHITLPIIANMHIPEYSMVIQEEVEKLYISSTKKKRLAEEKYKEAEVLLLSALGLDVWKPKSEKISIRSYGEITDVERFDAEYFQPKYDELFKRLSLFECCTLSEIVNISKSIEPGSEAYQKTGIPFYRVADLSKEGLKEPNIFLDENKYYREDLSLKKDMILFSKDGSIGIAYKVDENIKAISSGALLHLMVKTRDVLPDYLTLVLNSIVVALQAERDAGGSIIQHWRTEEIEKVTIPVLNMDMQERIKKIVRDSFILRGESKQLLNQAQIVVETAINKGEEKALQLLN